MSDLTVDYMGLKLINPLIAGSSGLTGTVDGIKRLEDSGIAAVVLKSLFEEQILMESDSMKSNPLSHAEEADYLRGYIRQNNLEDYLRLLEKSKKETSIPVIASINCISADEWTTFAKNLEDSGADAVELNMFLLPGHVKQTGEEIEQVYFDIVKAVSEQVSVPIAAKIGFYFSSLAKFAFDLSVREVEAIVMFNRFYRPDIDLKQMELVSADVFSTPHENTLPLRWIGLLSDELECDLSATTGIHDGKTAIKNLLAGAKTVQIATVLYKNGPRFVRTMLDDMTAWLTERKFQSVTDIIGKLSHGHVENRVMYERSQFMRYFSSRE